MNSQLPDAAKVVLKDVAKAKVARAKAKREDPYHTESNSFFHLESGKEFVRVPAGPFLYGDAREELYLDEFWIAKTPVTNAEYARFVAEMKVEPPRHWNGNIPPVELVDHPVVGVSWHDAKAFAEWTDLELPTEAQWEKAARGIDGREYPWGNDWREDHCNTREAGIGRTSPVGQFTPRGDSVYGRVDMAGNVWEWTESMYHEGLDFRVLRGGSWFNLQGSTRAAARDGRGRGIRDNRLGFRVVNVGLSPSQ